MNARDIAKLNASENDKENVFGEHNLLASINEERERVAKENDDPKPRRLTRVDGAIARYWMFDR